MMKKFNIIISSSVREKANIFFETHGYLIPKFKKLVEEIKGSPYKGKGRPHRLTRELDNANCWARCLDKEHRLVYVVSEQSNNIFISHVGEHY